MLKKIKIPLLSRSDPAALNKKTKNSGSGEKPPIQHSSNSIFFRKVETSDIPASAEERQHLHLKNIGEATACLDQKLNEPRPEFHFKTLQDILSTETIGQVRDCILYAFFADDRTRTSLSTTDIEKLVEQRLNDQLQRLNKIANSLLPTTVKSLSAQHPVTLEIIRFTICHAAENAALMPSSRQRCWEVFDAALSHCREGTNVLHCYATKREELKELKDRIKSFQECCRNLQAQLAYEINSLRTQESDPIAEEHRSLLISAMSSLNEDLETMKLCVTSHFRVAKRTRKQLPLSDCEVKTSINRWCDAAKTQIPVTNQNDLEQIEGIRATALKTLPAELTPKIAAAQLRSLRANLIKELKKQCKTKGIKRALENAHNDLLNKEDWDEVSETYYVAINDYLAQYRSRVRPAASHPTLKDSYDNDNIKGICSGSKSRSYHPANLWITSLERVSEEKSHQEFCALRHATISTDALSESYLENKHERQKLITKFGLSEDATTQEIKKSIAAYRLDELITLGVEALPALRNTALEEGRTATHIALINLLTSIDLFGSMKIAKNDRGLIDDQAEMIDRLAGRERKISIVNDSSDPIDVFVAVIGAVSANIPVNFGRWLGDKSAREKTTKAMNVLFGSLKVDDPIDGIVGIILHKKSGELEPHQRDIILQLIAQIRTIMTRENGSIYNSGKRDEEDDIYQLPARLTLLLYHLGIITGFHCASGKDRTGHLNIEIDFLVACINAFGRVPEPGPITHNKGKIDTPLSDAFSVMALRSPGGFYIQNRNTGSKGYKTKSDAPARHRLSKKYRDTYGGASDGVDH